MNYDPTNAFAAFTAFPGAAAFEKLFSETTGRSEEAVNRSRKLVEEFAEITRGNVDAVVESSRIAAAGAQALGQQALAKSRDNIEQATGTVRSFTEAKTPAELLQLQGEYARTAFDRFVEQSSNVSETMVKLASDAFQPISNRASENAERFNDMVA